MATWSEIRQWQPDVIGQVGDHLAARNGQVIGLQDELDGAKPDGWAGELREPLLPAFAPVVKSSKTSPRGCLRR